MDGRTDDVVRWLRWRHRRRRPQTDGRQGLDRTTRSKGLTDSEPRTLPDLMDQKWSPYGSFFWAGSKNLWAEPNHAHREYPLDAPSLLCSPPNMPKHWTEQQWIEMFMVTTETTNIESFLGIRHHAPTSKQYKSGFMIRSVIGILLS